MLGFTIYSWLEWNDKFGLLYSEKLDYLIYLLGIHLVQVVVPHVVMLRLVGLLTRDRWCVVRTILIRSIDLPLTHDLVLYVIIYRWYLGLLLLQGGLCSHVVPFSRNIQIEVVIELHLLFRIYMTWLYHLLLIRYERLDVVQVGLVHGIEHPVILCRVLHLRHDGITIILQAGIIMLLVLVTKFYFVYMNTTCIIDPNLRFWCC